MGSLVGPLRFWARYQGARVEVLQVEFEEDVHHVAMAVEVVDGHHEALAQMLARARMLARFFSCACLL